VNVFFQPNAVRSARAGTLRLGDAQRAVGCRLAFTLVSVVLTYPVAPDRRALPSDLTDTLLTTDPGRDADRLRHGFSGLWDAPIFSLRHPAFQRTCSASRFRRATQRLSADPDPELQRRVRSGFTRRRGDTTARELTATVPRPSPARTRVLSVSHWQTRTDGRDRWMPVALGLHRYFSTRRLAGCGVGGWILQTLSTCTSAISWRCLFAIVAHQLRDGAIGDEHRRVAAA
jgi:hypothetical protein